ncbi:hypothetical protein DBV15_11753 [Temnothorax longispinosus]|uniref:Caspase family p20 domain-containing protein n=1 Tax=Temnothorax longispinosus TaxID=300112 RepID=A0A4S2KVW1_9HYME|nr:hypothetical protein DBV15_11753 [Temnothorax longispinosus]
MTWCVVKKRQAVTVEYVAKRLQKIRRYKKRDRPMPPSSSSSSSSSDDDDDNDGDHHHRRRHRHRHGSSSVVPPTTENDDDDDSENDREDEFQPRRPGRRRKRTFIVSSNEDKDAYTSPPPPPLSTRNESQPISRKRKESFIVSSDNGDNQDEYQPRRPKIGRRRVTDDVVVISDDSDVEKEYHMPRLIVSDDEEEDRMSRIYISDDEEEAITIRDAQTSPRLSSDDDDNRHPLIRRLNPTVLNVDDPTSYIKTSDIDSLIVVCRTLEPFKCDVICKIHIKPKLIMLVNNTKLTRYIVKKDQFRPPVREPAFAVRYDDEVFRDKQTARRTEYCGVPWPHLSSASSYARHDYLIPTRTETTQAGIKFAKLLTERLGICHDLTNTCGMSYVRLYMYEHDMRLPKDVARCMVDRMVDVDHPHVDIVQIHRADVFRSTGPETALLVKLSGTRRNNSLVGITADGIKLTYRSTHKYRVGFTADYGYFDASVSPQRGITPVTYMQTYILLGGQNGTPNGFRNPSRADTVSQRFKIHGVFDYDRVCITSRAMLRLGLCIYKMHNWGRHTRKCVGRDLRYMGKIAQMENPEYATAVWTPSATTSRAIRAEFRGMYFAHGINPVYNYQVTGNMFLKGRENNSVVRGMVRLRPLDDPTDDFIYPLYTSAIKSCFANPIRHARDVAYQIDTIEGVPNEDKTTRAIRFVVALYASWAYSQLLSKETLTSEERNIKTEYYFQRYKRAFKLQSFLMEYQSHPLGQLRAVMHNVYPATRIAQAILEPKTPFARVARMTVRIDDELGFHELLTTFIANHVDVFPMNVMQYSGEYYAWCVIKKDKVRGKQTMTASATAAISGSRRSPAAVAPPSPQPPSPQLSTIIEIHDSTPSSTQRKRSTQKQTATELSVVPPTTENAHDERDDEDESQPRRPSRVNNKRKRNLSSSDEFEYPSFPGISTTAATSGQLLHTHMYYNMNHPHREIAIIFNHKIFKNKKDFTRFGTEIDSAEMDHSNHDTIIISVLTHGHQGRLMSYDASYATTSIWNYFTAEKCPTLAGKSKLFFIEACQGSQSDPGFNSYWEV